MITSKTIALAALAAAAFPAAASPAFDAFRVACGDTHDDYAAVIAGLDAAGWKHTDIKPNAMAGITITDKTSRSIRAGDHDLTLSAWRGVNKTQVQVTTCTVRVGKAKAPDLQAEAQAWLGFAPQEVTPKLAKFDYTDAADAHTAVTKDGYEAAAGAGGLEFLTVSADGPDVILDLLKIKK